MRDFNKLLDSVKYICEYYNRDIPKYGYLKINFMENKEPYLEANYTVK